VPAGIGRVEVPGLHWSGLDCKAGTLGVTHSVKRVKDRDASRAAGLGWWSVAEDTRVTADTFTDPEMMSRFRQHRPAALCRRVGGNINRRAR